MLIAVIKMIVKKSVTLLTSTNGNSPHLCPMEILPIYVQ